LVLDAVLDLIYHTPGLRKSLFKHDDVLNENWIKFRMVRSHRSAVDITVTVGGGRGFI
jgi:hypothetical protein